MEEPRKTRDRQGREVLLSAERWEHIVSAHPEIEVHESEILRAVESPTTALPGREADEEWLYRRAPGQADG